MAVAVTTLDEYTEFPDSDKWVIDDNECLHIVTDGGNVASYYRGVWLHVMRVTPKAEA